MCLDPNTLEVEHQTELYKVLPRPVLATALIKAGKFWGPAEADLLITLDQQLVLQIHGPSHLESEYDCKHELPLGVLPKI